MKKNILKKVMSIALAGALTIGTMCQGTFTEAKTKHAVFINNSSAYNTTPMLFIMGGENNNVSGEISSGVEVFSYYDCTQGKNFYLEFHMPEACKLKSVSLKSGNKKVLKVVNQKQGKMKGVKIGNTKLTAKITWKYTGKTITLNYPVLKKSGKNTGWVYKLKGKKMKLKKGKTYSLKYTFPVKVFCKKSAHKYSAEKTIQKATCQQEGIKQRKCTKCEYVEWKYLDSLPHKYGDWTVTKQSTCTEKGERTRVCSVCKEEDTEKISRQPHQYDSTTHRCTVCGEYEEEYEE